jgi:hypothetical protein
MVTTNAQNINGLTAWYRPKSEADLALLTPEEQWAGTQMGIGILLTYDNVHFQFEHGFISEEGWNSTRVNMKEAMGFPFVSRFNDWFGSENTDQLFRNLPRFFLQ